jgi:ABC-type branched-subunit amino acid transport system ATPase component
MESPSPRPHEGEYILETVGLTKRFGGLEALADVDVRVARGSITSLIGPNGAGKSTFFNVGSGSLKATSGQVRFQGRDVTNWAAYRTCALGMARTFQNIELFPTLNVIENVLCARYVRSRAGLLATTLFLPSERRERKRDRAMAENLLERVGIADSRYRMPSELPYGHRRRLEIARALATEPQLIMLDEPSAGMVASEVDRMMDLVSSLRDEGKTLFLIEHNMTVVMSLSDSVHVLNFGRKIAEGTPEEVRSNPDVITAYLGAES